MNQGMDQVVERLNMTDSDAAKYLKYNYYVSNISHDVIVDQNQLNLNGFY